MSQIMVDLETMGTSPGSVIVSIGAVVFDPLTGELGPTFYQTVSLESAEEAGLRFDAGTVRWWLNQGDAARTALFAGASGLREVLQHFTAWWDMVGGTHFWSHGANFDEPVLSAAYRACKLRTPWPYSASRCTRTIFDLAGVKIDRSAGVQHDALDDACAQARAVHQAFLNLGLAGPLKAPSPQSARVVVDIATERARQVHEEGRTPSDDDLYQGSELALAASCYAEIAGLSDERRNVHQNGFAVFTRWPWDKDWWKPKDRRRDLVRAGALIVAEIERLDRKAAVHG